jgi:hypothetical protein
MHGLDYICCYTPVSRTFFEAAHSEPCARVDGAGRLLSQIDRSCRSFLHFLKPAYAKRQRSILPMHRHCLWTTTTRPEGHQVDDLIQSCMSLLVGVLFRPRRENWHT